MTDRNEQPDGDAFDDEDTWLTDPLGVEFAIPWPPDVPDPQFRIVGHWRRIDGQPKLVGVDIRSFVEYPPEGGKPAFRHPASLKAGYGVVDHALLRSLRATDIADGTLKGAIQHAARMVTGQGVSTSDATRAAYAQQLVKLTTRGEPRKRAPAADDELLGRIATLYREALAAGGTVSRRPAKYVEEQLRAGGLDVKPERVRAWIQRCRKQGLLAATTERKPG